MTNFYRLRTRHFRIFLALCDHQSLSRAAEALNTVQPALSRALKEMETEIGTALFERTSTGILLTDAGETLRQFVTAGVSQIEEGLQLVSVGSSQTKKVSIGILPNVARGLVPEAVARFKAQSPDVLVRLYRDSVADLVAMMRGGTIDFIASRMIDVDEPFGLTFEYLYSEPLVFVAAGTHPLAGRDTVLPDEVDGYPVIVPNPGTFIRIEMDRFLFSLGFRGFRNVIETISLDFTRSYVACNKAIACVPLGAVANEIASGTMVRLPFGGDGIKGSVGLTFANGKDLSPEARRMIRLVHDVAAERGVGA